MKKILFSATSTEKKAGLLDAGKLVELVVERPDQYRILGNIYRGRVASVLPGIQSAFIDVGLDKSVFLHASDVDPTLLLEKNDERIERYTDRSGRSKRRRVARVPIEQVLSVGQEILVQVTKEPIGSKSPRVTTQISMAGRFLVLVPDSDFIGVSKKTTDLKARRQLKKLVSQLTPKGIGFIVRTMGLDVPEASLVSEINTLVDQWRKAQESALSGKGPKLVHKECDTTVKVIRDLFSEDVAEVVVDQEDDHREIVAYLKTVSPQLCGRVKMYKEDLPLFDRYHVEKDLERCLKRKVWMKNGGYLLLDHAEALLAIDVNTGRNVGKADLEETVFETNLEAAHDICRQLRLRDIGGLIVIDFIDMQRAENRRRIESEMKACLARDPTATASTGLSKFGLMEITRKRVRPELQELFTDVCPSCNGLGRIFSPATVAGRIDRWLRRAKAATGSPTNLVLAVPPSISAYLEKSHGKHLSEFRTQYGFALSVVVDEDLDEDEFAMYPKGSKTAITEKFL